MKKFSFLLVGIVLVGCGNPSAPVDGAMSSAHRLGGAVTERNRSIANVTVSWAALYVALTGRNPEDGSETARQLNQLESGFSPVLLTTAAGRLCRQMEGILHQQGRLDGPVAGGFPNWIPPGPATIGWYGYRVSLSCFVGRRSPTRALEEGVRRAGIAGSEAPFNFSPETWYVHRWVARAAGMAAYGLPGNLVTGFVQELQGGPRRSDWRVEYAYTDRLQTRVFHQSAWKFCDGEWCRQVWPEVLAKNVAYGTTVFRLFQNEVGHFCRRNGYVSGYVNYYQGNRADPSFGLMDGICLK